MDALQKRSTNPLGHDESCRHCPALVDCRKRIVHGYGAVDADFMVIGEAPDAAAESRGIPFGGDTEDGVLSILEDLGLIDTRDGEESIAAPNVYLTYLARCRHPDRPPTDAEVGHCDPFLTAEVRMINPEILIPVGERPLRRLAFEHTTTDPETIDIESAHATEVRGRGFEIVPMIDPAEQDREQRTAFLDALGERMDGDYRQTKGRRGEETRERDG